MNVLQPLIIAELEGLSTSPPESRWRGGAKSSSADASLDNHCCALSSYGFASATVAA